MSDATASARSEFEQELLSALPAVHRFSMHLAREAAKAEDLVQETYVRALAHRDQYTPGTECRAWLFAICRNLFLRGEAKAEREVAIDDADLEALAAAGLYAGAQAMDPQGQTFEQPDLEGALERALAKLPEEFRSVVVLVDIEDQSYAHAARVLGVPIGTVRSRLFRARRLLQQELLVYAQDAGLLGAARKET